MSLLSLIPDGVKWGDYYVDYPELFNSKNLVLETSVSSSEIVDTEGWEVVGQTKQTDEAFVKAPKWCKHGNACVWSNCKFRHERCEHYDKWVASNGKTRGCRCQQSDPNNCKSPEDGGCKYDHRDLSQLDTFIESVQIQSEQDLWENFYDRGLDIRAADHYDLAKMNKYNKALLLRSLQASKITYEDLEFCIQIQI